MSEWLWIALGVAIFSGLLSLSMAGRKGMDSGQAFAAGFLVPVVGLVWVAMQPNVQRMQKAYPATSEPEARALLLRDAQTAQWHGWQPVDSRWDGQSLSVTFERRT